MVFFIELTLTSQYSDIISNSIIALLKRDIRRVIFIKEKLFGQQLPILLRQFVWTECLLRFEKGSLDYDLVNISFIKKKTCFYFSYSEFCGISNKTRFCCWCNTWKV